MSELEYMTIIAHTSEENDGNSGVLRFYIIQEEGKDSN